MNASDCTPGSKVVIGGKYLRLGDAEDPLGPLWGVTATVVAATGEDCGPDYPHGMVRLDLPEGTRWSSRQVHIGPEDLAPPFGEGGGV